MLVVDTAFGGDNSTLQEILLNLEKCNLKSALVFARKKTLENIYAKLKNGESFDNYSKFHQGEYSILGEAPEGNLLNSEPVRKYITDKLAGNPSDFDAIYSSLEKEKLNWKLLVKST
jgi:hypothetical protein